MPIYAYRCPDCGHAQDHLMKMEGPAPACPNCGAASYAKQVTAAAFALKGSGFYATDFKGAAPAAAAASEAPSGSCGGSCACHPG